MHAKHITDLTLTNFRGFGKLELKGLQSVNLIVGQNNVGKSSLLEGLLLAANPEQMRRLAGMLHGKVTISGYEDEPDPLFDRWIIKDGDTKSTVEATGAEFQNYLVLGKAEAQKKPSDCKHTVYHTKECMIWQKEKASALRLRVVSALPSSARSMVTTVGNALRKRSGEDLIHSVLKKVDSRIQRIRVDPVEGGNIVAVDIGLSEMIPMSQAGQGAVRLVSMLAELIGENAQICIIDEIENGIHHTALKDLWRGIAEISAAMGVQVFATTHSQECLTAAHEVFFAEDAENKHDFAVVQLMRVKDQVIGKVLTEARVDDALVNDIELR